MGMMVHTFIGKANLEGLQQMDHQINDWLKRKKCEPLHIHQCFGTERHHGSADEPVLLTSIWYNAEEEEF